MHARSAERLSDALDALFADAGPAAVSDLHGGGSGRGGEDGMFLRHPRIPGAQRRTMHPASNSKDARREMFAILQHT